jgi:uncharacterized protein
MRYTLHLSVVLALLIVIPCRAFSLEVPQLKARVNDYAGVLSPAMAQKIEERLALLEQTDSTQVVVLTIPSLEGEALEDFSIRVAEKWKIGQKLKDNGVILLVARDDRKVRIEVGRGLEGKLTDLVSGRIIRNTIIPNFKKGDFDNGIWEGTGDIINVVKGEYVATDADAANRENDFGFKPGIFLLLVILAGPIIGFVSMLSRKSKILGGVAGGAVGSAVGYFGFLSSFIGLGIFGIVGFVIGIILGLMKGSGTGSWGGFGGSSFGGSGGGFGGGGGGFSGGGGSFGGGGSSGSW